MMTKSPHALSTHHEPVQAADGRGLLAVTMTWIQQALCGLHGHDSLLQHQRNRIFLRCASCGYETPGWDVSRASLGTAARGEARSAPVAADLAVARKVA